MPPALIAHRATAIENDANPGNLWNPEHPLNPLNPVNLFVIGAL
jgi:hypothetical protein